MWSSVMVTKKRTSRYVTRKAKPLAVREAVAEMPFVDRVVREIGAAEFKARCLELMNDVQTHGGEYVITKRGQPVARLVPVQPAQRPPLFGSMKGTVKTLGDIVSPLDEPWEALEGWPFE